MPPRGKFYISIEFDPGFNPLINCRDRSHTSPFPLISLAGLPGYLGDNHYCDDYLYHDDDDVEGI